jgi:hypothetical protein
MRVNARLEMERITRKGVIINIRHLEICESRRMVVSTAAQYSYSFTLRAQLTLVCVGGDCLEMKTAQANISKITAQYTAM